MRGQQTLHQVLQPVGFVDDDLGIFAELRVVEFAFEQLRRTADAAERILDLVRQIADQFAVGLLLFEQALLARSLNLLVDRPQFEQQAGIGDFDVLEGRTVVITRNTRGDP